MLYREINITDVHIPYHDPFAWQLTLNIVKEVKPTKINLGGDIWDFYLLSSFDKDPKAIEDGRLQENIDQGFAMMRELKRAAPETCEFEYIPGNHEDRLRRYLMRNPELYGLRALELPTLLRLGELGIKYSDYEIEVIPGLLHIKHGSIVRRDSAMSARAELEREKYTLSLLTGHTHRKGIYYTTTRLRTVKAVENGCLCRTNPEYVVGVPNWQQGITKTTHWGGELFDIADILYLNSGEHIKAVVDGMLVTL